MLIRVVKLYLRVKNTADLAPGMPVEISSTFATQEEALAQAVHDLQQDNRAYLPQRIESENGDTLVDHAALEQAAGLAQ